MWAKGGRRRRPGLGRGLRVLSSGDPAAVRRRAADILPDHMLPATVTALDTLPLTADGKLDTARLPAPAAPARATEPVPADDDLIGQLRAIWGEVPGRPVGRVRGQHGSDLTLTPREAGRWCV